MGDHARPGHCRSGSGYWEVDWLETPLSDLVPLLRQNADIAVEVADPLGNIGAFRMNHLHPPFDNVKIRQAVATAISQEDYMRAVVGDDEKLWRRIPGFFTPGTTLYTEAGGNRMGQGDIAGARKMLAEAGYKGEPVTCLVAQDQAPLKSMGDVTADLLKRLGMTVDFVATDLGTVGARRASKAAPAQGGWSMFHTWHGGADCVNPAIYPALRGNGDKAWFGWPSLPAVEAAIGEWFTATAPEQEKTAGEHINAAACEGVVFAPTGFFLAYQAWRKNVKGIVKGPLPFTWGVSKT